MKEGVKWGWLITHNAVGGIYCGDHPFEWNIYLNEETARNIIEKCQRKNRDVRFNRVRVRIIEE